jgi:hypothetical protein
MTASNKNIKWIYRIYFITRSALIGGILYTSYHASQEIQQLLNEYRKISLDEPSKRSNSFCSYLTSTFNQSMHEIYETLTFSRIESPRKVDLHTRPTFWTLLKEYLTNGKFDPSRKPYSHSILTSDGSINHFESRPSVQEIVRQIKSTASLQMQSDIQNKKVDGFLNYLKCFIF